MQSIALAITYFVSLYIIVLGTVGTYSIQFSYAHDQHWQNFVCVTLNVSTIVNYHIFIKKILTNQRNNLHWNWEHTI